MSAQLSPPAAMAKMLVGQALDRLKSIDVSLTRLVELAQAPRENLFAAGSIPFGGTVGALSSTCTVTPPLGQSPGVVLAANPHRRGLGIQNLSAAGGPNLTIGLGLSTPIAGAGLVLAPGAAWDGRVSGAVWTGSVSVVASAAGCTFSGLEILGRNETRRRGGNLPI